MKNKLGLLGLLGIPIALLGVVGSVALAAENAPTTTPAVVVPAVTAQVADTDVETNDDASTATVSKTADTGVADTETNDDASGPQEAPGIEQAD